MSIKNVGFFMKYMVIKGFHNLKEKRMKIGWGELESGEIHAFLLTPIW